MTNKELHQKLTSAANLQKALVEHFSYLADSDGFVPALEAIMSAAQSVELKIGDDRWDNLIVHFPEGKKLICWEPDDGRISDLGPRNWCKSFLSIRAMHYSIELRNKENYQQLDLSDNVNGGYETFESNSEGLLRYFDSIEDIHCPLTDFFDCVNYAAWWIYHPTQKNPQGEPLLVQFQPSEDLCDTFITKSASCNVGSLFLKRLSQCLHLDVATPDVETLIAASKKDEPKEEEIEPKAEEPDNSAYDTLDGDVSDVLAQPAKDENVPKFIAGLEKLSAKKISPKGYEALFNKTETICGYSCFKSNNDNKFPVFEAFLRLFPNAKRRNPYSRIAYTVLSFLNAIKNHRECYPQLQSHYDVEINGDDMVRAYYQIAVELAKMGWIDEALAILQRIEASRFCVDQKYMKYEGSKPADFSEPFKGAFKKLQTLMRKRSAERQKKWDKAYEKSHQRIEW